MTTTWGKPDAPHRQPARWPVVLLLGFSVVLSLVGLLTTMQGLAARESVRLGHAPPLPPRREAASPEG